MERKAAVNKKPLAGFWASRVLTLVGIVASLTMAPLSWGEGKSIFRGDQTLYLTSQLSLSRKPELGKAVTATYTIKAEKDGLRDIVIHLEAGRIHEYTVKGPVRHDIEIAGSPAQHIQSISLSSLGKGATYTASITIQLPNINPKNLLGIEGEPASWMPIVAAWATFKMPDGKTSYACKIGTFGGRVEGSGFEYTKGSFFAYLYRDTEAKPNESNQFLHYWGPTDGTHESDFEWIRNLESVRKALDLPEDVESRSVCVHLWDNVEETAKKEKVNKDLIISRMANEVKGSAAKEKISNIEAAQKYLRVHSNSSNR